MEMKLALMALQSLSQETRLLIFRLLVRAGTGGLAAGDISGALGVPAPTLSFHLTHLSRAGLIERRRDGRSLYYRVSFDQVRGLLQFLMEDCCQGSLDARADQIAGETCCGGPSEGCTE